MSDTYDVIIAGAGPVGLSLAAALTKKKIRTQVLEALPDLSDEARASTFHPRTLEMFAEWGVADAVVSRGRRIDRLQFWERTSRELVAEFDYASIAGDTSHPFRLQCPQSVATRCLFSALEASPLCDVRLGHAVVAAEDHGTHASVVVESAAGRTSMSAKYVVGCDGSKSHVRESLGLGLAGATYPDRFLLAATDLALAEFFPRMGPVAYVFDPDEWVIVMHLPDVVRVVFRLANDEDEREVKTEESVRARMRAFLGKDAPFELFGASVYSVHRRVCDTFRVGNVLLAGDAAHINNPAGGMGMNSGIHDAFHLADALEAALVGGDEGALDRYAGERRRAAVESVQQSSDKNYKDLVARERTAREARNRELAAAAGDPARARAYLLRASMLEDRIDAVSP